MSSITPDVSVILVSWNTRDLLLACLAALPQALGNLHGDVWVVDNGSVDGSVEELRAAYPEVQLLENKRNVGFAAANNRAIRASSGRYVLLLNSDTVPQPGSFETLVHFADQRPWVAAVGPMLLNPDGSFQGSFAAFPTVMIESLSAAGLGRRLFGRHFPNHSAARSRRPRAAGYIQGACMLVRRRTLRHVGMMDETYFMYSEEVDWCLRMWRAHWEVWYTPDARVIHYGGQSTRQMRHEMVKTLYRSKVQFFSKHYGRLRATTLRVVLVVILGAKWHIQCWRALNELGSSPDPRISWRDLHPAPLDESG